MGSSPDEPTPPANNPNVTRIPLSADPTQPIKLVRPKPVEPKPAAESGADEEPSGDWKGDDATMVGGTPIAAPAQPGGDSGWRGDDRTAITPAAEDWKGDDATVVPAAAQSGDWKGDDATMVGGKAPARPGGPSLSEWKGDDATQLGMAGGGPAKPGAKQGTTNLGSRTPGSRPTSIQMDDGWHFKGRQGPLTGTTVGDYEMGGILGEGGMGTVYRARQISLKRRAAVKVLPPNLAADLNLRTRFEQEAHTASLLNTPHVVQVFGAGTSGDVVYFAMEYVEGVDLSHIIHEKREKGENFTPEEAAGYVIQAARGLAEASKHNIVHRDIKPANLMVTTKGVVKIADFGISKVAGEHGMTMTGTAVGTPAYCSPEQGRGDQVDPRADLYSLGVAFYELLTGRKPFDGTTANALIYQHNYQEPKLPTELRPDLPDAYQAVCLKCLMKNPDQRYQDANELIIDLERVRDGNMSLTAVFQAKFGTGAEDAMAKYLGVRKRWWVKWVIAASFLAIFGGGGLFYYSSTSSDRLREKELRQAEILEHKRNLVDLDAAKPIPKSASDDLAWLDENASDDPDLPRWQKKLDRVGRLTASLAVLDLPELPDLATRRKATTDLTAYTDDVGNSVDAQRWEARLAEADRRIAALREAGKAEIDPAETITGALHTRVGPGVAELSRLAGAEDPDAARWSKRLADADAEIAAKRRELAVLDAADAAPTEAHTAALAVAAGRLALLTDTQDADVLRWNGRIAELGQELTALRGTLGEALDQQRALTLAQQDGLKPYLERYRVRVSAGDPQLVLWSRRLGEAAGRVGDLRTTLGAALDAEGALPSETALAELTGVLKEYATLVPADDAGLVGWSARLRGERDAIDSDRAVVSSLDKLGSRHLTIAERTATEKALARLDARGAITADRKGFYQRKLAEEKGWEEALRADLRGRSQDPVLATANETLAKVNELTALAGLADPEVKQWREKLGRYFVLHDALKPLDEVTSLPQDAERNLDAFAKEVGEGNEELKRWRAKLVRVDQLTRALAGIDEPRPLPAGALANATELVEKWLGRDDPQARAWLAKATQVTALRDRLTELFDQQPGSGRASNQVLPPGSTAVRDMRQLIELTGDTEPIVRHWRYRAATLFGPGRPAWATTYERDAYGPYAELAIEGQPVRLRWIPGGVYTIGSPVEEAGHEEDEPQIPGITISRGFWLADSECTQALWQAVMGVNPSRFAIGSDAPDKPVERVSCVDIDAFCKVLSPRFSEAAYPRLPTEAEWEYACRAGVAGPYATFTGDADPVRLDEIGWLDLNDGTRGVRRKAPNRFGLFDMHGNVWEWCADKYGAYSAAETIDPRGRQETTRIARGGCWADPQASVRAANRIALRPEMRTLYVGFRIAIPAEWPAGTEPKRAESDDQLSQR